MLVGARGSADALRFYVRRKQMKLPVCPIYKVWSFERPHGMQLYLRAQRIARVIHDPQFASEAGCAPTIGLQLKFHAPIYKFWLD